MPLNLHDLETEALKLDLPSRAALARRLLLSLEDLSEEENERLWTAEALRRKEELQSGRVTARDGDTVLECIAAELS
jgi:hypothetical protein